jgi:integrase
LVKRNQNNKVYPKGWRVRKQRRLYRICFRTSDANKHYWNNQTEYLLGSGATLGAAEKQAYKIWTERIITTDKPFTLQDLFDRYELQVIPNKAAATQKSNRQSFKRLRSVFDLKQPVIDFKTHQAYQYRDYVSNNLSAKRANLDVEVLSHLFTKAIEWGCNIQHPIKGIVGKISIPDRDRYVEDEELKEFLSVCNAMQKVYIPLKLATGKDKSMLLRIKLNDITSQGIKFPKRQKNRYQKRRQIIDCFIRT